MNNRLIKLALDSSLFRISIEGNLGTKWNTLPRDSMGPEFYRDLKSDWANLWDKNLSLGIKRDSNTHLKKSFCQVGGEWEKAKACTFLNVPLLVTTAKDKVFNLEILLGAFIVGNFSFCKELFKEEFNNYSVRY